MKLTKSVIITDLDNTLYDWVDIWHSSFNAMLQSLVKKTGISQDILEKEFKEIHQKHGTSEYAFSLEELPSLRAKYTPKEIPTLFADCIKAFRDARSQSLKLYPTVLETLCKLKSMGCLIVGYTESMAFYSRYRIKKLGLDGIIDYLYSPKDHDLSKNLDKNKVEHYQNKYNFLYTVHRNTPAGELKPNPNVLKDILIEIGAFANDTIYIGDSLMKDVGMAQDAEITDVLAEYGVASYRKEYELLRRVTHWKKEDVEREKRITKAHVEPTYVLKNSFQEVLELFEFSIFRRTRCEDMSYAIELWKKTVDVQQHFNDLSLRVRNYSIAVLTAILGLTAIVLKEKYCITLFKREIPLAPFILLLGLLPWIAFWLMDRIWYHVLLIGAVKHGEDIERRWAGKFPEILLTHKISEESAFKIPFTKKKLHSKHKFLIYYGIITFFMIIVAFCLFWGSSPTNESIKMRPEQNLNGQSQSSSFINPSSLSSTVDSNFPEKIGTKN